MLFFDVLSTGVFIVITLSDTFVVIFNHALDLLEPQKPIPVQGNTFHDSKLVVGRAVAEAGAGAALAYAAVVDEALIAAIAVAVAKAGADVATVTAIFNTLVAIIRDATKLRKQVMTSAHYDIKVA